MRSSQLVRVLPQVEFCKMVETDRIGRVVPLSNVLPGADDMSYVQTLPPLLNDGNPELQSKWTAIYGKEANRRKQGFAPVAITLKNALVLSPYGAIVTKNGYVMRTSYRGRKFFPIEAALQPSEGEFTINLNGEAERIEGHVLVPGPVEHHNYFHWMTEGFVRAFLGSFYSQGQSRLFLPLGMKPFVTSSIQIAGWREDQIFWAAPGKNYAPDLCTFYSTPARSIVDLSPYVFELFGKLQRLAGVSELGNYPERILISRDRTSARFIHQSNRLDQLIERHKFQVIYLEDLTLQEQIGLFTRAKQVLSPHGAGLTNLLFSNREAKVVEVFPETVIYPSSYWAISEGKGIGYAGLMCQATDPAQKWNSPMQISRDEVDLVEQFLFGHD